MLFATLVVDAAAVVFIAINAAVATIAAICVDVATVIDDDIITGRGPLISRAICASEAFCHPSLLRSRRSL